MTAPAWIVAFVVMGAMALYMSERVRFDVIGLMVMSALILTGVLSPREGLSGFSNEATIAICAMFALNAGVVSTGALEPLIRMLTRLRHPWLLTLAILLLIAVMGAFIKNTALVATFLPIVLGVCARTRISPARILMPMSFAAQMGGVCTLLGTSSNLLTNGLAIQNGLPGFGVFEFSQLGAILAVMGIAYLMLVGRWLLPERLAPDLGEGYGLGKFVTELRVEPDSPLIGQSVEAAKLAERHNVFVLELLRGEQRLWAPRAQELAAGDVLLVRGDWSDLQDLRAARKLALTGEKPIGGGERQVLIEALVAPGSRLIGGTLEALDFRGRYDASVLAVQRRGQIVREPLKRTPLDVGDVLLLVTGSTHPALPNELGLITLSQREHERAARGKAPMALGILAAVIVVAGLGWLPIAVSALLGCVAMAFAGCYRFDDVYAAIDWKIIILLGSILPLGIAMEKTGLAQAVVDVGLTFAGEDGAMRALLMTYLLTALLTELMGHNPSVVLMVPIAVSVAHALHASPQPFVVAVAFAAATSFATPIGYPTNTLVYNAGGYRFSDFMRVGIPLIALFCAASMYLIPRFWPL